MGDLVWKVQSVRRRKEYLTAAEELKRAEGMFLVLQVVVRNPALEGARPVELSLEQLRLTGEGEEYAPVPLYEGIFAEGILPVGHIGKGLVLFDVPPNLHTARLSITQGGEVLAQVALQF
ncbi:MAG TPA: hypothetical protein EYP85_14215 [Armatimonadetes bacterium]|nr:hypothetical protein [Armatimonadota bacterium]